MYLKLISLLPLMLAGCSSSPYVFDYSDQPEPTVREIRVDHQQARLSYMDDLSVVVSSLLPDFEVERMGLTKLRITVPESYGFETGSDFMSRSLRDKLKPLADMLLEYRGARIQILGHTDNVGNEAFNRDLSHRRAISVVDLLAWYGVDRARMTPVAEFYEVPRCTNQNAIGRECNRRVEIILES